jgi:hypothetical protein
MGGESVALPYKKAYCAFLFLQMYWYVEYCNMFWEISHKEKL